MRHDLTALEKGHQGREIRSALVVALIMAFRMLGLFMILPVFALAARHLRGATPTLIGLALGAYGLTQALLQIPFGKCSDHFGRKPVIAVGLLLFAAGSVMAALSHSIYSMVFARALQGAGAVGSTCLALLADMTRDEFRTRAMAILGMCIGLSFVVALALGPLVQHWFHLAGIFWLTAALALLAIVVLFLFLPSAPRVVSSPASGVQLGQWRSLLSNVDLLRLDWAIFSQHAILTIFFLAVPSVLTQHLGLSSGQQVRLYLVVMLLAFLGMGPTVMFAEKKRQLRRTMLACITLLALSLGLCWWASTSWWWVTVALCVFFIAFCVLEAILPSWVTKQAPLHSRGTAMGIYSSSQFCGIFVGGLAGGYVMSHAGVTGVFLFAVFFAVLWLVVACFMREAPYFSTLILSLQKTTLSAQQLSTELAKIPAVSEVAVAAAEGLVYLKLDKQQIDVSQLRECFEEGTLYKLSAAGRL